MLFDLPLRSLLLSVHSDKILQAERRRDCCRNKRAASGLGTDFRGHGLPVYIQLANTPNTASTSGVHGDAMDLQNTENKFCHETSRQARGTGHKA